MDPALVETAKTIDRRYVEEILNKGHFEEMTEFVAPDYVGHITGFPQMDRHGEHAVVSMFRQAFPDMVFSIEDHFSDGERVAHRIVARGTHTGVLMGIAPTGKTVEVQGMVLRRINGGKIVEGWIYIDMLGLIQKLNVVPPQGAGKGDTKGV